jgi:DNA-binding CsgD family transcriptional regulator
VDAVTFGREAELAEVEAALASGRRGFAALVLEGDPGIGKTTVWRAAIANAAAEGCRVLSCRAVPAEARLSFAALGDLLAPVEADAFAALPDPQRRALDAALLRADAGGAGPNPRAIGTGIVTLLSALAASAPVVIAMDDVQWLDLPSARALDFAFRRLDAHPVAALATRRIGVRDRAGALLAAGSIERTRTLRLGPLSLAALYRIVEVELGRKLPRPLLVRIERASAGNPFFALEIARALGSRGSPAVGEDLPIPGDLSQLVVERMRRLPQRTRDALLRASALAQPTVALVAADALAPAEDAGVVRIAADGRIEFAHPLFANAVYGASPRERRRELHAALARLELDVEERARHLMLASAGDAEDESVARVLQEAGAHASRRGAAEIAAELFERSAQLTPVSQGQLRHESLLRAAQQQLKAGDPGRARALSEAVLGAAPAGPLRAEALLVRARTTSNARPAEAIPELEEALACADDDPLRLAQLEIALASAQVLAFRLAAAIRHAAHAVELAEQAADTALLAQAVALREVARVLSGEPLDEAALARALALEDLEADAWIRPSLSAVGAYAYLGKMDVARARLVRVRERLVAGGEPLGMPWIHCLLALTSYAAGDLVSAEREASEAERAGALGGREIVRLLALMERAAIRALRGDAPGTRADAAETLEQSERMGWPHAAIGAHAALGHLALSGGDLEGARGILEPSIRLVEAVGVYEFPIAIGVPDLIEALVATGEAERAGSLTQALAAWGRRRDRPWALATAGRCEALLAAAASDFERALTATEQALVAHERLAMPFERARTMLVRGQLQRRAGERRAARETLQQALSVFEQVGARLWAERARAEIARIGVRRAPDELTESEERVAELAAQGLTNPEIAGRLFMSRRTVEANLARAYRKLEIRSRAELGAVMARRKAPSPS